jgi:hypothetical protein
VEETSHPGDGPFAVVDELGFYGFEGRYSEEGFSCAGAEAGYYVGRGGDGAGDWVS